MKKRKFVSLLLAVVFAFGILVACGSQSTGSTASKSGTQDKESSAAGESDEKIVLNYWTWESGIEPIFEAFYKDHPNIEINVTKVASAGDYLTKIQQSVASGAALPDLLLAEVGVRGVMFEMDIWEDLEKEPYNMDRSVYFDSMVQRNLLPDGTLVGMDLSVNPAAFAYKRTVAEKYFGTSERKELEQKFNTFDDLLAAAKEVNEKSSGEDFLFSSSGMVMDWLYYANSTPLVAENGTVQYTEKMKPVYEKLIALRDANGINNFVNWTPQNNASYATDNHLFYPSPNWAIVYLIKANDPDGEGKWGMMMPVGGGYSHGGTTLGVYKDSPNKEAAYTYLNWIVNTDNGVAAIKDTVNFYAPTTRYYDNPDFISIEDSYFPGQDVGKLLYDEIVNEMTTAPITPYDSSVVEVNAMMAQAIMTDRNITAETALNQALTELKNLLPDATIE